MPSFPGINSSVRTISGAQEQTAAIAARPLHVVTVAFLREDKISSQALRVLASLSMIRIWILVVIWPMTHAVLRYVFGTCEVAAHR